MDYKTTKKDFEVFKKEAEYWLEYFHLHDWEVHFEHCDARGNRARCWSDISGRMGTLEFGTEWSKKPDKYELQIAAFHEVCELLLSRLSTLPLNMFDSDYISEITHEIIRRLENTIFKEKRSKK